MKKNLNTRNGSIHLYNPKKEGLGSYDVHYINACRNKETIKQVNKRINERYAA